MRVYYERTGGFAGIRRTTSLDTRELSGQQARELQRLVEEANFFELPREVYPEGPQAVDRFHYKLTVTTGELRHTVEMEEDVVPEGLRPLIRWLTATSGDRPTKPKGR